jgi:hypothetical protein
MTRDEDADDDDQEERMSTTILGCNLEGRKRITFCDGGDCPMQSFCELQATDVTKTPSSLGLMINGHSKYLHVCTWFSTYSIFSTDQPDHPQG